MPGHRAAWGRLAGERSLVAGRPQNDQKPGHHLYHGRNARSALAEFRADMVQHFSACDSRRYAIARVRALCPVIIAGPMTDVEAFQHLTGWTWAWEICLKIEDRTWPGWFR